MMLPQQTPKKCLRLNASIHFQETIISKRKIEMRKCRGMDFESPEKTVLPLDLILLANLLFVN